MYGEGGGGGGGSWVDQLSHARGAACVWGGRWTMAGGGRDNELSHAREDKGIGQLRGQEGV